MTLARLPNEGKFAEIAGYPANSEHNDEHGGKLGDLADGFLYTGDRPRHWQDTSHLTVSTVSARASGSIFSMSSKSWMNQASGFSIASPACFTSGRQTKRGAQVEKRTKSCCRCSRIAWLGSQTSRTSPFANWRSKPHAATASRFAVARAIGSQVASSAISAIAAW